MLLHLWGQHGLSAHLAVQGVAMINVSFPDLYCIHRQWGKTLKKMKLTHVLAFGGNRHSFYLSHEHVQPLL